MYYIRIVPIDLLIGFEVFQNCYGLDEFLYEHLSLEVDFEFATFNDNLELPNLNFHLWDRINNTIKSCG